MKTFETEKHNTPKGATHYWNESCGSFFAWWNDNTKEMLCPDGLGSWSKVSDLSDDIMHEIPKPRTKTEFVKVEFEKLSDAAIAVDTGEIYYTNYGEQAVVEYGLALHYYNTGNLKFYRKVEVEIDEQQEFIDAVIGGNGGDGYWFNGVFVSSDVVGVIFDSGKVELVEK